MRIHPYLRCAGRFGLLPLLCLALRTADAGSATWNLNPSSGDWNTPVNWTPNTVPNGSSAKATFGVSNTTAVSISAATQVNGIVFSPGASAFMVAASPGLGLTISGVGIMNNSGSMQNFISAADDAGNRGAIMFTNSATAGNLITLTNQGTTLATAGGATQFFNNSTAGDATFVNNAGASANGGGGRTEFFDNASAGNGTFITNGAEVQDAGNAFTSFFGNSSAGDGTFITNAGTIRSALVSVTQFLDNSTAANGSFTVNGGAVQGASGGFMQFLGNSSAGNATITINGAMNRSVFGGGALYFRDNSTAGNATLIVDPGSGSGVGGQIQFVGGNGGSARLEVFGNGIAGLGKTWGSIEGDGQFFTSSEGVAIGSNNLSTIFSGVIADNGSSGGLTKVGTGTLTLSGANTYTGATTVSQGALVVANVTGSATGTGAVTVTGGTLGGRGIIAGTVTVGTGAGGGAFLAPAFESPKQFTLTLQSSLTLQADATYTYTFKARNSETRTDLVMANGVTINGATIALTGKTQGTLTPGTVLTVISNTSANPISGTFSNLADGAIVNVNGNNLQASYSGGDGNDLTLTVVP